MEERRQALRVFQRANREFEEREGEDSSSAEGSPPRRGSRVTARQAGPPNPGVGVPGEDPAAPSIRVLEQEPSASATAAEAAVAVEDMKRLMEEFGVDLATVTQAFLKNSGEVAAVTSCLQTGQRPDGFPLWNRQDDVDLLKNEDRSRHKLEAKYGVENVNKRVAFRNN